MLGILKLRHDQFYNLDTYFTKCVQSVVSGHIKVLWNIQIYSQVTCAINKHT